MYSNYHRLGIWLFSKTYDDNGKLCRITPAGKILD